MVTHDMEAALEESSHILCLCQRHGETADHGHANFFGETEAYRASLGAAPGEDKCSCCGMAHEHRTAAVGARKLLVPAGLQSAYVEKEKKL